MRYGFGAGIPGVMGRRAWTPAALGSSLALWLRADLGVTLNGATVSAWADQSGNGRHATQGTAANQPTYQATDADFAGAPSIRFNTTTAYDLLTNTTALFSGNATHAMFVACRMVAAAAGVGVMCVGSSTAGTRNTSTIGIWGTDWWYGGDDATSPTGTAANTSPHVLGKTYDSATTTIYGYKDGAQDATANISAATPGLTAGYALGSYSGGGTGASDVEIAEVVILSGVPTTADRALLTRYMGARYGITVA